MNDELEKVFPLPLWFVIVATVLFSCGGCATTEEAKVCFMKAMGVTEEGYTVAAVQCMTPEAFAESQK